MVKVVRKNRLLRLIKKFKLEREVLSLSHLIIIFLSTSKIQRGVLLSSNGKMPNILLQSLYLDKPVLSTDCRSGPKELKKFGYSVGLTSERCYRICKST